ncbi:hypothetical protein D3C75_1017530 [compost metagenome]
MVLHTGADYDNRQIGPGADFADNIHPIQIRQSQVENHDVRLPGGHLDNGRFACVCRHMSVALGIQCSGNQLTDGLIILHHQHKRLIHPHHLQSMRL